MFYNSAFKWKLFGDKNNVYFKENKDESEKKERKEGRDEGGWAGLYNMNLIFIIAMWESCFHHHDCIERQYLAISVFYIQRKRIVSE